MISMNKETSFPICVGRAVLLSSLQNLRRSETLPQNCFPSSHSPKTASPPSRGVYHGFPSRGPLDRSSVAGADPEGIALQPCLLVV